MGRRGQGCRPSRRKPQLPQPPRAGRARSPAGPSSSPASGGPGGEQLSCRFRKSSRPHPGPPRLLSLGRCWAGLQDHLEGIGLALSVLQKCPAGSQPRSCGAAAGHVCGRGCPGAERRVCPPHLPPALRVAHCLEPEGICIQGGPEAPHRKTEM